MNPLRLLLPRAATVAAFFFAFTPLRASLDVNPADGIPDIWALRYGSGALSPTVDTDGDGQKNSAEAAAGTNPMQAGSVIKITNVTADAGGVHLTFPTEQGKRYQIQTAATLVSATWVDLGTPLAPDASPSLTFTNNAVGATGLFYRVRVQDIDSDGDGVSDWEEMQVGFDPYNSHSHGLAGAGDLAALTTALSAVNVITVTSSGVPITEPAAANTSTDLGTITIHRSGNLNPITVNYTVSGSATPGSDYAAVSGTASFGLGATSATVTIAPLPDALLESPESVIVTAAAGAGYTVGSPAVAAVLINDYAQANGSGLTAKFWEEGAVTLSQTVLPTFTGTSINGGVYAGLNQTTASWGTTNANGSRPTGLGTDLNWSSRWTGEVLPQYSQLYTFSLETNFAGRLYVNGKLVVNNWPPVQVLKSSSDDVGTPTTNRAYGDIELTGGVRAAVVVEHYQDGGTGRCYLRWESANQVEEYIPAARLFATAPPQITSALSLLLLKDSPLYTYQILASSTPTSYGAVNLPPGWTINTTTGVISGLPSQVGTWAVPLTATNALGSGSAILTINVIATDGGITRDLWTGVAGSAVTDIPLTTTPTSTSVLTSLEGPQNAADNYGSRIRGYITAPTTGTYKFWLTADDAAELWISDDGDPVNSFKRAALTSPVGYRAWASGAVTPLLYLEAGSRYYVEVRHKEGTGTDHVSVGWLKPGDAGAVASEVVPGYALSQYTAPTGQTPNGTLYFANLLPQGAIVTSGSGTAILRLSADETTAILTISYSNLSSPYFGMHVHDDRIPNPGGGLANVICDIDQPGDAVKQSDGTYLWVISARSGYTAAQLVDGIKTGHAYFNVHSTLNPNGEIKGYYRVLDGSQTFTPPAAPPSWTDDHTDANAASRFLIQSTFGPTSADIAGVQSSGYDAWIESQFLVASTHHLDFVIANRNTTNPNGPTYYTDLTTNSWWKNSILGSDQLRQRVAFALSEILVVSTAGPLEDNARVVSAFYDKLLDDAFGNFRTILEDVTLTPAMGIYLDMRRNDKPNLVTGAHPNENYAREIKQLFSIGLNRLHPDGTLVLNAKGELIPTYGQDEIIGFAHAFTGWDYHQNLTGGLFPTGFAGASDYINPMTEIPEHHFTGQKRILNRVVLPGLTSVAGVALDPYADHTKTPYSRATTINDPTYQALPAQELDATHDALFNHPNCAPFICRQLIQRLVTSTPSPGYIYRVVSKFMDNGSGVRGDMKAVVKAILLDYEARSTPVLTQQGHGKQREPVLRVSAVARAFAPPASVAGNYVQDGGVITVDTSPTLHRLVSGNPVSLAFAGAAPLATTGDYSVSGSFPITTTSFSARTKDVIRSTYTQSGTTVSVATGSGATGSQSHGLVIGDYAYVRFRDGTGKPADGVLQVVTVPSGTQFTATVLTSATISPAANSDVAFLRGAYSQRTTTVTLTCGTVHGLTTGANVSITFVGSIGAASLPTVGTYPVTVIDDFRFSYTAADSASRDGTFNAAADVMVLNRSGTVTSTFSNWTMGGSDTDIAQTPMRSPTVFNFFLPDYQFPGVTSNAGLITPEFQLTSETNVIRSANFLYDGIFNPSGNTTGLSSFRSGGGDIGLDFSVWMANGPGAKPWTNNENLNALIDQLNTLLMGGLLPSTGTNNYATNPRTIVNAKQAIYDYVINTTNISYTNTAPTDTQKMARIRAVIHLIVTSPDFTIQK